MKRGRVIGEVWGARRAPGIDGWRLLLVTDGASDRVTVAIDTLGARTGQEVLVAFGSGARNVIEPGPANRAVLADAAIALLVDGVDADGGPDEGEDGGSESA